MTMDISSGITSEIVNYTQQMLRERGVVHLSLIKRGGKQCRIVIATMPDMREIMVAIEGSGCTFLSNDNPPRNEFVLISDGFQLLDARLIVQLFAGLAQLREAREASDTAFLALTHDRS